MKNKIMFLALLSLLSACGGGGSGSGDPDPQLPANRAPAVETLSAETLDGAAIELDLTQLVSDADGDSVSIKSLGMPAHGSATSAGLVISFDPEDSYAGSDSFSVTVTDGQLDTTATVSITAYQGMRVSGKVVDEPVPGARVTVNLGGQAFEAIADEQGNYTIEFRTSDLNAYVKLVASGSDAQGTGDVSLVTLLGEAGILLDEAGAGRELDSSSAETNITNVTTARYVLALEANGGAEIDSQATMELVEKSIDADKLLEIAAVIKLLLDSPDYSLPDGVQNVLEFVTDVDAYNQFVEQVTVGNPDDNDLTRTMDQILADPELTQGFTASSIASAYYVTYVAAPGFLSRGGELMELDANGIGRFASDAGVGQFGWSISNGNLVLEFQQPWEEYGYYNVYDILDQQTADQYYQEYGSAQVGALRQTKRLSFTRLINGSNIDTVSVASIYDLTYDAVTLGGQPVAMPNQTDAEDSNQQLLRDADASEPLAIELADLEDSQAAYSYYDAGHGLQYTGDFFEFSPAGTGSALLSERSFNWTLQGNTLRIAFSDDTVLEAQKLDAEGEMSGLALRTFNAQGDLIAFRYDFGTWHDDTQAFSADNLATAAGLHWATFVNGWAARFWSGEVYDYVSGSGFGWEFSANGAAVNVQYFYDAADQDGDGNTTEVMDSRGEPGSWEVLANGTLSFTRCPSDCRRREWFPLQIAGDAIIVLEREYQVNQPDEVLFIPPRVNIYRKWNNPAVDRAAAAAVRATAYPSRGLSIGG